MANIPGGDFCQHIIWLLSVVGIFVEVSKLKDLRNKLLRLKKLFKV